MIFSADLRYHGDHKKPSSGRKGDRVSGGRSLCDFEVLISFVVTHSPSPDFVGSFLSEGAYMR